MKQKDFDKKDKKINKLIQNSKLTDSYGRKFIIAYVTNTKVSSVDPLNFKLKNTCKIKPTKIALFRQDSGFSKKYEYQEFSKKSDNLLSKTYRIENSFLFNNIFLTYEECYEKYLNDLKIAHAIIDKKINELKELKEEL